MISGGREEVFNSLKGKMTVNASETSKGKQGAILTQVSVILFQQNIFTWELWEPHLEGLEIGIPQPK